MLKKKDQKKTIYLIIGLELDKILTLSRLFLQSRPSEANKAAMSKDMAMKTLGLLTVQGQGQGQPKTLSDYSEDDITQAFQKECDLLGNSNIIENSKKYLIAKCNFFNKVFQLSAD